MKNFINISDISLKDLRKILKDARTRKNKRQKFQTLEPDKGLPLKNKLLFQIDFTFQEIFCCIRKINFNSLDYIYY